MRNIQPAESSIIAGETIEVEFDLVNIGFMNRSGSVPYSVYWVSGTNTWRYTANDLVLSELINSDIDILMPKELSKPHNNIILHNFIVQQNRVYKAKYPTPSKRDRRKALH